MQEEERVKTGRERAETGRDRKRKAVTGREGSDKKADRSEQIERS
jgi:hypothetical protein